VAIHKKGHRGNNQQDSLTALPAFSYPADKIAPIIVTLWGNTQRVLDRDNKGNPTQGALDDAKTLFNTTTGPNPTNYNLVRPVVITEEEHDNDWYTQDDTEVVFVLPNKPRIDFAHSSDAQKLETAKLLMACTPNGI
jgi:hypothetical protein